MLGGASGSGGSEEASGGQQGSGGATGGDSGTGGEENSGGCVDEVGRYQLLNDQTVWHAAGSTTNPDLSQILLDVDESPLTGVTDVASGTRYGCAVDVDGGAWCWAGVGAPNNTYGELGDNLPTTPYTDHRATRVLAFAQSADPELLTGVQALQSGSDECTGSTNCAVVTDGALWCWGQGSNTTFNSMPSGSESRVAIPIQASSGVPLTGVDQVSVQRYHICALSSGQVWCWGSNASGQLGQGDQVNESYPQLVDVGGTATQVAVGRDTSCALLSDGTVKCWGSNRFGTLGIGDPAADDDGCSFACKLTPVSVTTGSGVLDEVVQITLGSRSDTTGFTDVCALRDDGSVWCWGEVFGTNVATPVPNDEDEPLSDAVRISMCAGRIVYLTEDGRIFEKDKHSLPALQVSACQ